MELNNRVNFIVDKVLTHPLTEATKTALRFVPGVGIFIIGVDRLTRWKLAYSSNSGMIATLEKKMADIASTYVALVEILPKDERRADNPRLMLFSKRTHAIQSILSCIQKQIDDYHSKNEGFKLMTAEVIQSVFSGLQKVLDETIRDVQLHLSINTFAASQEQKLTLNSMENMLIAQKTVLEKQGNANQHIIALLNRQTSSFEHFDSKFNGLKEELVPGYARVNNLEVTRLWYDFFRWPAFVKKNEFLNNMPLYFQMREDNIGLQVWFKYLDDIPIILCLKEEVTAFDLSNQFPFDANYHVSVADWIVFKCVGWVHLFVVVYEQCLLVTEKYIICKGPTQNFMKNLTSYLVKLKEKFKYDEYVDRLREISAKVVYCNLVFKEEYEDALECIGSLYEILYGAYSYNIPKYIEISESCALVQCLATIQLRMAACLNDLVNEEMSLWSSNRITEMIKDEESSTMWAHSVGTAFSSKLENLWNGRHLISPHMLSNFEKSGNNFICRYLRQQIFMMPIYKIQAGQRYSVISVQDRDQLILDAIHQVAELKSYSCPMLVCVLGITIYDSILFCLLEYFPDKSLNEYLSKQAIKVKECMQLIRNITEALMYLHANGAAHSNISEKHVYMGPVGKLGGLIPGQIPIQTIKEHVENLGQHGPEKTLEKEILMDVKAIGRLIQKLLPNCQRNDQLREVYKDIKDLSNRILNGEMDIMQIHDNVCMYITDTPEKQLPMEEDFLISPPPMYTPVEHENEIIEMANRKYYSNDLDGAKELYQKAVNNGILAAKCGVADTSIGDQKQLYTEALEGTENSYNNFRARCFLALGNISFEENDFKLAMVYWIKCINCKDERTRQAWAGIGDLYLNGLGVSENPARAAMAYRRAWDSDRAKEGMRKYYCRYGELIIATSI